MEEIHKLLLERNARETDPFLAIYESNSSLRTLANNSQLRCENLEADKTNLEKLLNQAKMDLNGKRPSKTELKQQEKIEKIQLQLSEKIRTYPSLYLHHKHWRKILK